MSPHDHPPVPTGRGAEYGRPEHDLIIRCVAQTTHDDLRVEPASTDEFDWEYFIRTVAYHQITPLVYRCLSNGSNRAVPSWVMDELKTRTETVAFRNLEMTRTLHRVLDVLGSHDIRALPYKGPSLTAAVHDELATRRWSDLDILLPKEEVLSARRVLLDEGFRPKRQLTPRQKRTVLRSGRHISVRTEDDIRVELHLGVTGRQLPFDVGFEELWTTRVPASSTGRTVPEISSENLLLLLAVHGNRHCWRNLAWLCDFAGLVATGNFDWKHQLDVAAQHGAKRMLLVGIALVRDLTGVDCPSVVLEEIRAEPVVKNLARQVTETFLWERNLSNLLELRYLFNVRERYSDKLKMATRLAVSPTETDYEALPASMQYYPVALFYRPVRVTRLSAAYLKDAYTGTR